MNAAQSADLVKNGRKQNRLWFLRKQFNGFLGVFVPSEVGFEVEDTSIRSILAEIPQKAMGQVDHKQRKVRSIGHGSFIDVHEIFHTPILFGILKVEFDLKT